jgi:hypothetical protein
VAKDEKKEKVLGPATVVKPCVLGAIVLFVLNAVLTFVLGGGGA